MTCANFLMFKQICFKINDTIKLFNRVKANFDTFYEFVCKCIFFCYQISL